MGKKMVVWLLLLATFLSCSPAVIAESGSEYTKSKVEICFNGATYTKDILKGKDGTVYVPVDWLTFFGLMECTEHEDFFEFYDPAYEKPVRYSKRIFINKDKTYEIGYYAGKSLSDFALEPLKLYVKYANTLSAEGIRDLLEYVKKNDPAFYKACSQTLKNVKKGYSIMVEGNFSKTFWQNEIYWVPMKELLALFDAHVDIKDGKVQIMTVPMPVWKALAKWDLSEIVFRADDEMLGEEVLVAGYYTISTIMDRRYDRIVSSENGAEADYQELFKAYLVDNKTYLSSFDGDGHLRQETMKELFGYFTQMDSAVSSYETLYDVSEALGQSAEFLSENFLLKESDVSGVIGMGLTAADKVLNYAFIYENQVNDHRRMLGTMYNYYASLGVNEKDRNKRKGYPSYKAALAVQNLYGQGADRMIAVTQQGMKDLAYELLSFTVEDVILSGMKPATITFDVVTGIMKTFGNYDDVKNGSLTFKADTVCKESYNCYATARSIMPSNGEEFERLRLLALMTLVSSHHAFQTYRSLADELDTIEEMLVDFYMAAESIPMYSYDYISKTSVDLYKKQKELNLIEIKPVDWEQSKEEILRIVGTMGPCEKIYFETDAFLYTGTKPEYVKREENYYEEELDYTFYKYYYKKSDVDAWSIKYFGIVFSNYQYHTTTWAHTFRLEGNYLVVIEDSIDPRALGRAKFVKEVSSDSKKGLIVWHCRYGIEFEPEENWTDILVTVQKTDQGYSLRKIELMNQS